jgi:class 3 adenylate cyclase
MGDTTEVDRIAAGREALARHDWRTAYDLVSAEEAERPLAADELELLAWASIWVRDEVEFAAILERAYATHLDDGNERQAAHIAVELAHYFGSVRLEWPVGNGWLSRATRLLADKDEGPEHGYMQLQRSLMALAKRDFEGALAQAREAERIGRSFGDRALEVRGLQRQGVALVEMGQVAEGQALLDEASTAAFSGELDPFSTLFVYCNTIGACRDVAAFDRAALWTERASLLCESDGLNAFPGMCRVNRAEVMRFRGRFAEAEEAAQLASQELYWAPRIAGAAWDEVGVARLRLGELAKAEEAFAQADELGHEPEPGRALVLLARGKAEAAAADIERVLVDESPGVLARARLLPAAVEIFVAAGNLERARSCSGELREIADRLETPAMLASALQAEGAVELAAGEPERAIGPLRHALRRWQETKAAYDAARARALLGQAYRAAGDEHGGARELAAAGAAFDRLGARLDSERVAGLLGHDAGTRVTKAFLFTDIVDSTKTAEALGDAKWTKALRWHDETLRGVFRANEGEVVEHTGDGFFVAFDDARHALDAAIAVQRALDAQGLAPDVRIGVHTAEATRLGANFHGRGVHAAARIAALGGPGEIVASRSTLGGRPDLRASNGRAVELKGLSEPVDVVTIDWR